MDQADAIQTYATSRDFEMKDERRCMALDALEYRPRKKFQEVKHNRTKTQFHRMSEQILEGCESFVNRIACKSVNARVFAHKRLQSPVSYVGIDMLSRTILKTMYRTISN